jgi:hypothetical protein
LTLNDQRCDIEPALERRRSAWDEMTDQATAFQPPTSNRRRRQSGQAIPRREVRAHADTRIQTSETEPQDQLAAGV